MEIPDDEVRAILRALTARVASLPEMPAAAKIEAERRLNDEALRAFQGRPSRLEDPDLLAEFLEEYGWPEMPSAELVAEQLSRSIEGHFTAYDDARRRGEAPVPEIETLRARLAAPAPTVRYEASCPAASSEPEKPEPAVRQKPRKPATRAPTIPRVSPSSPRAISTAGSPATCASGPMRSAAPRWETASEALLGATIKRRRACGWMRLGTTP